MPLAVRDGLFASRANVTRQNSQSAGERLFPSFRTTMYLSGCTSLAFCTLSSTLSLGVVRIAGRIHHLGRPPQVLA